MPFFEKFNSQSKIHILRQKLNLRNGNFVQFDPFIQQAKI